MQGRQGQKFGAKHAVLIVLMIALSVAIYMFKDKIIPNQNEAYVEQYSTFVKTEAVIVDQEIRKGKKGSSTTWIVEFKDGEGTVHTGRIGQTTTFNKENGESITVYYDPQDPTTVVSEETYKQVVK